ncbi:hypothetical protein SDC9_114401 [bioreactor metagenome]|uniref:Uncharacterized protein n=1 Tax=bioreactor metagenome TaxID=1076179 RepID=A0A645BQT4_9ZZZZ
MQLGRSRRVPNEARDAEAHVAGVAERGEHQRGQTNDNAGENHPQVSFFHVVSYPSLIVKCKQ